MESITFWTTPFVEHDLIRYQTDPKEEYHCSDNW